MYCVEGAQRGPLPGQALLKLLERGVVPMSCVVWRPSQAAWLAPSEAPGLGERARLVRCQFYVADPAAPEGRGGPFPLGELRRRVEAGDADGLSSVFVAGGDAWRPLGDVPGLRPLLATEEPLADDAGQAFVPEVQEREEPLAAAAPSKKRSFRGDDGRRYVFSADGEWVEADGDASSDDDDEPAPADDDAPAVPERKTEDDEAKAAERKAKRDKKKAAKKKGGWDKNAGKCWIYVEGLPSDVTVDELLDHFGKCGVVAVDAESNQPKVKIYRDGAGVAKGDGALCYANEPSVALALQILDGGSLRFDVPLQVTRADFGSSRYGAYDASKKRKINANKVKVAKKAAAQSLSWSNDDDSGTASSKALRIVVVERAFVPGDAPDEEAPEDASLEDLAARRATARDGFAAELQGALESLLDAPPDVDKCAVHFHRTDGVCVFKFKLPGDATDAIKAWDGAAFRGRTLKSYFWDGVTDYAKPAPGDEAKVEAEEKERIDGFGDWLEDQGDLPPELQLRVEA